MITGHSGAGKSEAIAAFEDGGYFCVDNLPPRMIEGLGELFRHEGSGVQRAAVVSDVRGGDYFEELQAVIKELEESGIDVKVLFLEADEETLLNRYKETRRRHPLARGGRLIDGIQAEGKLLAPLRERADVVIDTTDLTGGELRRRIAIELVGSEGDDSEMALTILTFGFKNGPPRDADLTLDVRFLPNPHYVDELRMQTGLDEAVREYVESGTQAGEFYGRLMPLLEFLVPAYVAEGKQHLTIAVGCTGGRHRSITVADRIARELGERDDVRVRVVHRDTKIEERRPRTRHERARDSASTGLRKSYGDLEAVRGIDIEIAPGEIYAFLGPNGAGKTTTVEILEGYRDRTAGEVSVLGQDPGSASRAWRERVGIVLQECRLTRQLSPREAISQYAGYYRAPRGVDETLGAGRAGGEGRRPGLDAVGRPAAPPRRRPRPDRRPRAAVPRRADHRLRPLRPPPGLGGRRRACATSARPSSSPPTTWTRPRPSRTASRSSPPGGSSPRARPARSPAPTATPPRSASRWRTGEPPPTCPRAIRSLANVEGVAVSLRAEDPVPLLRELTAWAEGPGHGIVGLEVRKPSLEDHYLALVSANGSSATGAANELGRAGRPPVPLRPEGLLAQPGGRVLHGDVPADLPVHLRRDLRQRRGGGDGGQPPRPTTCRRSSRWR